MRKRLERETAANGNWRWRLWNDWVRPLGLTGLLVFGLRSSLADWNDVPTGSMRPSILEGDRVLVNRLAYDLKVPFTTLHVLEWGEPARGDIVVFRSPEDGVRLVKRVIGLPGDVVELRGNRLWINGEAVPYETAEARFHEALPANERGATELATEILPGHPHPVMAIPGRPARRDFGPVQVPEGHYFMLGDNRDNSKDSRYFGFVRRSAVLGRATAVVASLDPAESWAPRWGRWGRRLP